MRNQNDKKKEEKEKYGGYTKDQYEALVLKYDLDYYGVPSLLAMRVEVTVC